MSGTHFKMLVRPSPLRGEHRMGYRLRVAALNGLSDAGWLPKALTVDQCVDSGDRTWRYARHCPDCLREQAVWRDEWTLAFLPVCLRHGVWLVDTCHACGKHLGWNKTRLVACQCGADLRQCHGAPLRDTELAALRALAGIHPIRDVAPIDAPNSAPLSSEQIAALVLALGASVSRPDAKRPKRALSRSDLAQCRQVLLAGMKILLNWPRNFEERLRRLMARMKTKQLPPLARAFASVYRPIFRGLPGQEFEFLRSAFVDFVVAHWPEPLTGRHRSLLRDRAASGDLVPLTRAAREAGMRSTSLLKKCRSAGIKLRLRQPRQGKRAQRFLSRAAVRTLSGDAQRASGIRAVGRSIGLSASRVRELIDSGLLAVHQQRPRSAARIPVQAIQELQNRLAEAVCPPPDDAKEFIQLGKALRYEIPQGQFGPLLARILAGSAPAYFEVGAKGKVKHLMVRTDDLCLATSAVGGPSTLSIPDVANRLSVKQEVAYSLVRNGHLRAQRRRIGMRHSTRINRDAVDDFLNRYVSAAEIARMRNTSPRAVISLLTAAGIHPVTGPSIDGCRQAFYLRRAVKAHGIAKRP